MMALEPTPRPSNRATATTSFSRPPFATVVVATNRIKFSGPAIQRAVLERCLRSLHIEDYLQSVNRLAEVRCRGFAHGQECVGDRVHPWSASARPRPAPASPGRAGQQAVLRRPGSRSDGPDQGRCRPARRWKARARSGNSREVPRKWGDEDGSDMTGRAVAGQAPVAGFAVAVTGPGRLAAGLYPSRYS